MRWPTYLHLLANSVDLLSSAFALLIIENLLVVDELIPFDVQTFSFNCFGVFHIFRVAWVKPCCIMCF